MTSFLSSIWTASSSQATGLEDADIDNLPENESRALQELIKKIDDELKSAATELGKSDPWHTLLTQAMDQRDVMLLRFLRYQTLHVERSASQIREMIEWRKCTHVSEISSDIMQGTDAGLPLVVFPFTGQGKRMLLFLGAEKYMKKLVVANKQDVAVMRLFEHILYASDGLQANSAIVVVDFMGLSYKDVDLSAIRRGIEMFLKYYPETFSKVLMFNYPGFVHGLWKIIRPLLDARTVNRVQWCADSHTVSHELEQWFTLDQIPVWLGGKCTNTPPQFLSGTFGDEAILLERFSRRE